ncbi:hypothetical protein SAMN05421823_10799 [Catalinimonas alkaloidigena]|uniref:Uncharacterized protein n=1 Tax=Catalinimonas alkaloidigena TaxID=1075417 RepID=A0A1G9LMV4_9BACT|nr:hypothetical protein [Catalinimonas alkaloidigena]SDL63117.1 hypothetical protein SAMN05421823_10799 [Catalinimonas alkaloidigena]
MTRHQIKIRKEQLTSGRIRQHRNFHALSHEYARAAQRQRIFKFTAMIGLLLVVALGFYGLDRWQRRSYQSEAPPHPEFHPTIVTDTVLTPLPPPRR